LQGRARQFVDRAGQLSVNMKESQRSNVETEEIKFFANYYEDQAYNPTGWRLRLRRELGSLLRKSGTARLGRVLSLGCGDGQFELMLAARAAHVTALDISPEAIALARRKATDAGVANVEFRCQPLSELSWNETYDAVVCLAFLHHVPGGELPVLLRRVHDHLVPGGFFYAEDPNVHGMLRKVGRVVLRGGYDRYHSPDERELDPVEVTSLLGQTGFRNVKVGYIDFTLIPALFVLAKGPAWPLYGCVAVDWLWCRLPLARWASGFTTFARK
jgi:2-polyprenyl-3-methyl-5-hydroxy-6-metoxy-1,4-benzoquinol methylase